MYKRLVKFEHRKTVYDHTHLSQEIQAVWVSGRSINFELEFVRLEHGLVFPKQQLTVEETSIILVHSFARFDDRSRALLATSNVFAEGAYDFKRNPAIVLEDDEIRQVLQSIETVAQRFKETEHFLRHRQFFNDKPWNALQGVTPEEACRRLLQMGW
jgi:hypothetical protein